MTRRTSTAVSVELGEGGPARFVFRGRRYRVRVVILRWVEARPWWRTPGLGSGPSVTWRVEASCGASAGVYDLREASGRWRLVRVDD